MNFFETHINSFPLLYHNKDRTDAPENDSLGSVDWPNSLDQCPQFLKLFLIGFT